MNNTSGKLLVEHWQWAADKGVMNKNTAMALRAASLQVLSIFDEWEDVDISSLDVEETLNRFQNLRSKEFKPQTLNAYKRRFRQSVESFLEYNKDPSSWKPVSQNRPVQTPKNGSKRKPRGNSGGKPAASENPSLANSEGELVIYPYPLRENQVVYLHLPPDLKTIEVKRLTAFMTTLTVDFQLSEA